MTVRPTAVRAWRNGIEVSPESVTDEGGTAYIVVTNEDLPTMPALQKTWAEVVTDMVALRRRRNRIAGKSRARNRK